MFCLFFIQFIYRPSTGTEAGCQEPGLPDHHPHRLAHRGGARNDRGCHRRAGRQRLSSERASARAEALVRAIVGLGHLKTAGRSTLQRGAGADARREEVARDAVSSGSEIVGLYFSAAWCWPCQRFTPELARLYEELREGGGGNWKWSSSRRTAPGTPTTRSTALA